MHVAQCSLRSLFQSLPLLWVAASVSIAGLGSPSEAAADVDAHRITESRPPVGTAAEKDWQRVLAAAPDRLDARWKLMRAIYYRGDYMSTADSESAAAWDEGSALLEAGVRELAKMDADGRAPHERGPNTLAAWAHAQRIARTDLARFYHWGSVLAGRQAENIGVLAAVRRGTADQVFAYVNAAVALEPGYDGGGPLRMLSALHRTVPRVPFVTGWVDRDRALFEAERALEISPDHPGNLYTWAIAVEDLEEPTPKTRATFETIARMEPRAGREMEDAALRDLAREWLARE